MEYFLYHSTRRLIILHYYGATSACQTMTPSSTYNHFNLTIESHYSAGVVLDHEALLISGGIGNQKKNNLNH